MNTEAKPKVPEKKYLFGMIHKTLISWVYVEPGGKDAKLFKPGWRPIYQTNYNHPFEKFRLQFLKQKQRKISERKNMGWQNFHKIFDM
jgi:hypothetical protein